MKFKSGFIALIGRPNAGKSTLLNALVKQKIAIMSNKPQTTRNTIRGILTEKDSQLIFVDTPGVHKPQHELGKQMVKEALSTIHGVDIVYLIVDVTTTFGTGDQYLLEKVTQSNLPVFLLLNKVDLIPKEQLIHLLNEWKERYPFKEIFPISALKENNLSKLLEVTKEYLTDGVQYYPDSQLSDYPEQFIIAEIIREKILYKTEQEIPHSVAVVIEKITKKNETLTINAMVLVERDSQKGIIIGKGGAMLKAVGSAARKELEFRLGYKVYLEIFVRVEKDWRNKKNKLAQLGYISVEEE